MRRALALALALAVVGGVVACGDDDESADEATPVDADSEATGADVEAEPSDAAADTGASAPEIDPVDMPAVGGVQFVVEGSTYDFASADAAGGPAQSCSVGPSEIVVELQTQPGALVVQASVLDGEQWVGSVTISPPGTDRIYSSTPGPEGTFAVDGSMAVYEGAFFWRTSADPGLREDAGVGTVRMSC